MSRWIRVGRLSFRRRMALAATGTVTFVGLNSGIALGPQLSAILLPNVPFVLRLLVSLLFGAALSLVVLGTTAALAPGMLVRADGSEIRMRRRISAAGDLDRATLLAPQQGGRST